MAICGTDCAISIDGNITSAHQFTLNWATAETDVRTFGSLEYGDFLACASSGTLECRTYDLIAARPGDTGIDYIANCSSATLSGNCTATSLNIAVEANGLVEYSQTFRLTGAISIV